MAILPTASAQGCPALSGYVAAHPDCKVFDYCRKVDCNVNQNAVTLGMLSVHNCEDPLQVDLLVVTESFSRNHTFVVFGEKSRCEIDMPVNNKSLNGLLVIHSRNASHLQFEVHNYSEVTDTSSESGTTNVQNFYFLIAHFFPEKTKLLVLY